MTFTPNMPVSGQTLGDTRDLVNGNFAAINNTISVNHVAMNSSGAGKHKFVEMPNQATIPVGLAASEGTVYCKAANGASQLFFTPGTSGNEYQLTRTNAANFAKFATNTAYVANHTGGWTFLPGGLLFQYGLRSSPGSSGAITFPVAFGSAPYLITVSLYRTSGDHNVVINSGTPPTTTTFNYICDTGGSAGVYWTAIGI